MNAMPQVASLSQITKEAPMVGAMLEDGPVLLTARTERFGVLVSVDEWNRIAARLELLEDLQEARRIIARNDANDSWVSGEEIRRRMAERGVHVEG